MYDTMSVKEDWPVIYQKILEAKIILFATPIWWNNHSQELHHLVEKLDVIHDMILAGGDSPLKGKIGGVIITGDYDGIEHVTGNIANFLCNVGITMLPYTSLGVIWEAREKNGKKTKSQILQYFQQEYAKEAMTMAETLAKFAKEKQ